MVYERTYCKETEDAAVGTNQPAYCRKKYRFELGMIPTKRHQYLCYVAAKSLTPLSGRFRGIRRFSRSVLLFNSGHYLLYGVCAHLEVLRVTLSGVSGMPHTDSSEALYSSSLCPILCGGLGYYKHGGCLQGR